MKLGFLIFIAAPGQHRVKWP